MKRSVHLKKYKVFLSVLFFLISSIAFARDDSKELLVFAGAGMRLPLTDVGEDFERKYGVKVLYDFEGSGRLGNKILVGQSPDIFIPGSDKWSKILKKKGYVKDCAPVAYHTPVIITPKGNSKVNSLGDFLDSNNRLVLGDDRACAIGGVSAAILKKAGLDVSKN